MFRKMDDFLIDKVFQRVADSIARIITVNVLAQNLLILCSLMEIFVLWLLWTNGRLTILLAVLGPVVVMFIMYWAFTAGKSTKPGMMPQARLTLFFLRCFFIVAILSFAAVNLILGNSDMVDAVTAIRDIIEIIGLYFMACRQNPPPQQTVAYGKPAMQTAGN